jgi:Periplasmic binding protein
LRPTGWKRVAPSTQKANFVVLIRRANARAGAKAGAPLCSDALPVYDRAKTTGNQRSLRQGRIFMRRNVIAALALLLWGAGLTAAVAQQPVKLGVLNDQTGLYADLTGMGSVHAARTAVEDYGGKVLGRPIEVVFADHQNKPDIGANIAPSTSSSTFPIRLWGSRCAR